MTRYSTSVIALLSMLGGCASTNHAYDDRARPDSEVATLVATGDIGFRIDRTVHNRGVAAQLRAVGDKKMGSLAYGFSKFTKVLPGATQITIHCSLPTPRHAGRAFETVYTYSEIPIDVRLEPGKTYLLRCQPESTGLVRGWIEIQE
jgi:hypothetical protein